MSILSLFLFMTLLNCGYSLPVLYRGEFQHATGKQDSLRKGEKISDKVDSPFSYYFTQTLDHFDRANTATFQQRYFLNTTYWRGAGSKAPVFLCVGGEGPPLDWLVLVSSVHCNDMVELAPKHGALLVALEHRYYGPSTPNHDYSTENLVYLNSEQALEDIASFHSLISEKFELTADNKWVTFGGSYPGMMAALARYRFPHLFHAAVSSSSPMQAQVEMSEYNDVVAQSMAAEIVGGSQQCATAIAEGHAVIGDMLKSEEGRRALEQQFNVCGGEGVLDEERNREQFAGDGVVYLPVQSNDPSCSTPFCNIADICNLMTDASIGTPLERLANLSAAMNGGSCVFADYDAMIKGLSKPNNPERSWLYQTCTEWGFYQTCPVGSQCLYTQGLHNLEIDYDICQQAFSVPSEEVDQQISATLARYGGDQLQGSRILFPNGQIDPWHSLGVLSPPNAGEPTLWVTGASHHFWTHPSEPTDSAFVRSARQTIWDQVDAWLMED